MGNETETGSRESWADRSRAHTEHRSFGKLTGRERRAAGCSEGEAVKH